MINFISLIYSLKKQYGSPLDIYEEQDNGLNIETGKKSFVRIKHHIKRAVVLPSATITDTPFLRHANILFRNSGQLIFDTRDIVIDKRDISIIPDIQNDYIVYNSKRFDIKEIHMIDKGGNMTTDIKNVKGYHIIMVDAKTENTHEQHNEKIIDRLLLANYFITNIENIAFGVDIMDQLDFSSEFIIS